MPVKFCAITRVIIQGTLVMAFTTGAEVRSPGIKNTNKFGDNGVLHP